MGREYPDRPFLGVGAVILDAQRRVLLVLRGGIPMKGEWSLPGGVLETGETIVEGMKREILEETGLRVEAVRFAGVYDRILRDADGKPQYHYVLVDHVCKVVGGVLKAGSDVDDVRWVSESELSKHHLAELTEKVIREALASQNPS
jgi:ADP-ribose pyrophosphatase YjhB (NUDIX family)